MVQEAMVKFHGSQCGFVHLVYDVPILNEKNYKLINNEIIEEACLEIYAGVRDIDQ